LAPPLGEKYSSYRSALEAVIVLLNKETCYTMKLFIPMRHKTNYHDEKIKSMVNAYN
jgi:hypothetical protein